jgi:hypothetical protein
VEAAHCAADPFGIAVWFWEYDRLWVGLSAIVPIHYILILVAILFFTTSGLSFFIL